MEIANNPLLRNKAYLFAVVIDSTEAFQSKNKDKFASKLKIIDASFNFEAQSVNPEIQFTKYASVYVYSASQHQIPKPKKVGDIVRLRRFNFVVSENGELVGHHQQYSNWLVYDGQGSSTQAVSFQDIEKNKDRKLTKSEEAQLKATRKWVARFLGKNSIHQIAWWNPLREPIVSELAIKNKEKASEVDLVLRTVHVNKEEKKVTFRDHHQNTYFLILHAVPVLEVGDVIKLKCVDVYFTKDGRYVRLTSTTSCLSMPDFSLDAKCYADNFPKASLPSLEYTNPFRYQENEDNYFNTRKKLTEKFPFLEHYNFEDFLINERYFSLEKKDSDQIVSMKSTLINKCYEHRIPTDLQFLVDLLNDPSSADLEQFLFQKFVVRCRLTDIINKKAPSFIKKHCLKCSKTAPINEGAFECCGCLMDLFFHLVFLTEEEGRAGETLQVPIYAVVGKDSHLFELWELIPPPDDYEGFLNWNTIGEFNRKMQALIDREDRFEVGVELKETVDHRLFLSLVDTLLMP